MGYVQCRVTPRTNPSYAMDLNIFIYPPNWREFAGPTDEDDQERVSCLFECPNPERYLASKKQGTSLGFYRRGSRLRTECPDLDCPREWWSFLDRLIVDDRLGVSILMTFPSCKDLFFYEKPTKLSWRSDATIYVWSLSVHSWRINNYCPFACPKFH